MGSFSIWHWIIVLLMFAVPALVVATTSDNYAVTRKTYVIRLLVISLGSAVLGAVVSASEGDDTGALGLFMLLALLAAFIYGIRLSAGRCTDAGFSKWWAVLSSIPAAGLVLFIVLLFNGTKNRAGSLPDSIRPNESSQFKVGKTSSGAGVGAMPVTGADQGLTRPGSGAADSVATRLQELDRLKGAGLVTEDEYVRKRRDILGSL